MPAIPNSPTIKISIPTSSLDPKLAAALIAYNSSNPF